MSTQLEEKLNKILIEKKEKILPENIKKGIKLFDVDGSLEILDTSDADATAKDIAMNKTAYVNGEKITGTLWEAGITNMMTNDIVDDGTRINIKKIMDRDYLFRKGGSITYHTKYEDMANAIGLTSEKIMKGNTVIGVSGNATSDADATAADIMKDKTAYVNGEKIVGTYEEAGEEENEYNTLISPKDAGLTTFDVKNCIIKIGDLDLTGVTSMSSAFSGLYKLTEIKSISNSSQVTNISNMFDSCQKITKIPLFDTSNVTNMSYVFRYCYLIKTVPQFNTSKVIYMNNMFDGCSRLASVPLLDTSNVTNMNRMFAMCELSLKEIPQFNTSKVLDFGSVFIGCRYLETIPALDASRVNKINSAFQNCTNLKNIGGFLNIGNNYTQKTANYGNYMLNLSACTALTHDSLMNIINNLYDLNVRYDVANGGTLYTQTLNLGSTNKAKLTAEEIAIATERGWSVS